MSIDNQGSNPSITTRLYNGIGSICTSVIENIRSLNSANHILCHSAVVEDKEGTRTKTASELLAESCANFGHTIGADKTGTSFGGILNNLSSYSMPKVIPSSIKPYLDFAGENLRNLATLDVKRNVMTRTENLGKAATETFSTVSEKFYSNTHVQSISAFATRAEDSLKTTTAGKVALSAGKLLSALVVRTPIKLVSITGQALYHTVKGSEKTVRMIPTAMLDTYSVLTTKSYTEIIGRTTAFLGYGLFATSYVGTHSAAALAGVFVFHELKASLAIRAVFGAIDGALHGEITAAAVTPEGKDWGKETWKHRIALGAMGAVVGALNFSVGSVTAGEAFEVGLTGKVVILTGMCLTSLITSPMVSFGEGIIESASKENKKPENLFYKDDIETITLDSGKWIRNQIVDLGKPLSEIRELWHPTQTQEAAPEQPTT